MDELYLGDGLYASMDSMGQIILHAPRGADGDHFVALEPEVFQSFISWCEEALNVDITITEREE